jgi:hypothetical protein
VGAGESGTRYVSPPWIIGKKSELKEGNIPIINIELKFFKDVLFYPAYFRVISNK